MPCKCSKKPRGITKQMQRRILEIEAFKVAKNMRSKVPTALSNSLLLDYHRKTHMLYSGNVKRTPVNKAFVNSIVDLHDKFVEEMLRRGMKHNTPLKKI